MQVNIPKQEKKYLRIYSAIWHTFDTMDSVKDSEEFLKKLIDSNEFDNKIVVKELEYFLNQDNLLNGIEEGRWKEIQKIIINVLNDYKN